jgi:Flp pilus assembly protein TadG
MKTRRTIFIDAGGTRAGEYGIAAVEFAFLVPVFLIMLMGVIDISQLLSDYYQLDQAVAAGAQYAALNAANVTSTNGAALATAIATTVESANGSAWANDTVVVNNGPSVSVTNGSSSSGGTAANANDYYCLTGSPPSWVWGTGYTTATTCSAGGNAGKFVTITASYSYVPILKFYAFIGRRTLTQNAAVQVQ